MSSTLNNEITCKLKTYRLSEEEYNLMKALLGREPLMVEWPLFSALWSEHCSYKSSKIHLRKFSFRNETTPELEGENAGIVDLGYGEKIAFKMESHNHPSFIEPVQGAATGVGGILRDIFTMGAKPIMSANYLCFGEVDALRMKYLMNGVVKGISSYGNCVGVPTLTGQTNLNKKYNKNILVNAMSVGYFGPNQKMALSKAKGEGNLVVYVGAKTGRDGVHGASMASASFDEDSESKKPNVQIGDPFYEKLLIEACLEVLEKNYVVAMQDMGAAGLTSSSFEMASKGQVGLVIDLKKVPLRDSTMTAEDILLSESQERMLLICDPQHFENLKTTFKKWSLDAVVLGEVQKERKIKLMWGSEVLTEIDPDLIVEKAPQYKRNFESWKHLNRVTELKSENIKFEQFLESLLNKKLLNSCEWIYNQYDQRVGARTAMACDSSVAFARLDASARGLSLAVGCRPEIMEMDAKIGALDAVYYPAFQMALKGATPLAITDCLNFGNPQKTEIMSEFVTSVDAIVEASKKINAPVISGNVSFYNETLGENIISTPAIGMVGIRDSVEDLIPDKFLNPYEHIIMITCAWVESQIYVDEFLNKKPEFKFVDDKLEISEFIKLCSQLDSKIKANKLKISAIKAIGTGGMGLACLKMSTDRIGFDFSHYSSDLKVETNFFKENMYSFLISTSESVDKMITFLSTHFKSTNVVVKKIGETTEGKIVYSNEFKMDLTQFRKKYSSSLEEVEL